jgi:hypothetical protein
MKIVLIAMSGIRAENARLMQLGMKRHVPPPEASARIPLFAAPKNRSHRGVASNSTSPGSVS